ncbi:MAG: hypothetical protein RR540_09155 [Oscillospiraceae bacterium]
MTNNEILELEVRSAVLGGVSIKRYLKALLLTLVEESENPFCKSAFGNGLWEREIRKCLIKNKAVETAINEHGEEYCEDSEFYYKMRELILSLCQ